MLSHRENGTRKETAEMLHEPLIQWWRILEVNQPLATNRFRELSPSNFSFPLQGERTLMIVNTSEEADILTLFYSVFYFYFIFSLMILKLVKEIWFRFWEIIKIRFSLLFFYFLFPYLFVSFTWTRKQILQGIKSMYFYFYSLFLSATTSLLLLLYDMV